MAKAAKRAKRAPRSVPVGSPKVPQHVEKAALVSPNPRATRTRSGRGRPTFWGYRRENGRVGVRNHVVILPLDDLSNAASEAVRRVSELISAHVIPSPAIDAEGVLRTVPPSPSSEPLSKDLRSLPVARLRQLARKTPGVPLQGRQISRANKDKLLDALRAAHGSVVPGADSK